MAKAFESLTTVKFQEKMRPAAFRIYDRLFPGCKIADLRENGVGVHVLDKEFGIDSLITFQSGQWISIQEKYRAHKFLKDSGLRVRPNCPDFTQEYKNASGTAHECDGEWFKLGAQLYFYGWSNSQATDFEKWAILDIAKYKLIVENAGGLERLGSLRQNRQHGSASFYCIPIAALKDAFVADYRHGWITDTKILDYVA